MTKMGKDYSRIHEIFYQDAGEEGRNTSLRQFLRHAFAYYRDRNTKAKRKLQYIDRGDSALTLYFVTSHNEPNLLSVEIGGEISNLDKLLGMLTGHLTAEYKGLELEKVSDEIKKNMLRSRCGTYAQAGTLGIYFSSNPELPDVIKRVESQKLKFGLISGAVLTPTDMWIADLDEASRQLLLQASNMFVEHYFHMQGDENNELVRETCNIRQSEQGRHVMAYQVVTRNGIPAYFFDELNDLFELVRDNFDLGSFKKLKMFNE